VNPAVLSADYRGLFPDGVAAAELRSPGDATMLLPAEAAFIGNAVQKRVQEYAGGRLCARRALAEFGIENYALQVLSDRRPAWPQSMVGSITHTAGLCAAVAGERRRFCGLGVDSEVVADVTPELWPKICAPREIQWLMSLPAEEQAGAAALIFAAKEAFYKCQYPVVEEFLSFHDVLIDMPEWGAPRAVFQVHAVRDLAIAEHAAFPVLGRYRFHEEFVSAGVGLPARAAGQRS